MTLFLLSLLWTLFPGSGELSPLAICSASHAPGTQTPAGPAAARCLCRRPRAGRSDPRGDARAGAAGRCPGDRGPSAAPGRGPRGRRDDPASPWRRGGSLVHRTFLSVQFWEDSAMAPNPRHLCRRSRRLPWWCHSRGVGTLHTPNPVRVACRVLRGMGCRSRKNRPFASWQASWSCQPIDSARSGREAVPRSWGRDRAHVGAGEPSRRTPVGWGLGRAEPSRYVASLRRASVYV